MPLPFCGLVQQARDQHQGVDDRFSEDTGRDEINLTPWVAHDRPVYRFNVRRPLRMRLLRMGIATILCGQHRRLSRIGLARLNPGLLSKGDDFEAGFLVKPRVGKRWSRNFGPDVKVDRMMREVIQDEETKEPFARFQSQGCA